MENKLKIFIKKYDIASPDWSKVPAGFPHCDSSSLNDQEKIIFDAAVLAWINEHPVDFLGEKIASGTVWSIAMFFIGSILISLLYYADVNYHLGLTFLTDFFA